MIENTYVFSIALSSKFNPSKDVNLDNATYPCPFSHTLRFNIMDACDKVCPCDLCIVI